MPIAIYRHMKLNVALPRFARTTVHNLSPRILRGLYIHDLSEGAQIVAAEFTRGVRQKRRLTNYNESWNFQQGQFNVTNSVFRNDRLISTQRELVPPLVMKVWVQNDDLAPVYERIEAGLPSRCIIEKYLFDNTPNPNDYCITVLNFDPRQLFNGNASQATYDVRDPLEVEKAILSDISENANAWLELLENA